MLRWPFFQNFAAKEKVCSVLAMIGDSSIHWTSHAFLQTSFLLSRTAFEKFLADKGMAGEAWGILAIDSELNYGS
jgi:hypothetical protein